MEWNPNVTSRDPESSPDIANEVLLWMVPLSAPAQVSEDALVRRLRQQWGLTVSLDRATEPAPGEPVAFRVGGVLVAVMHLDTPIPADDTDFLLRFHRHQEGAADRIAAHRTHLVVSVMGTAAPLEKHLVLTRTLAALLEELPQATCVVNASRLLLNFRENFLTDSQLLLDNNFALNQWVYFGYSNTPEGFTAYSYGMHHFGKDDVEIIESQNDPILIANFHYSICHYMVRFDKAINPGETVGPTDDIKIATYLSDGVCVAHQTLKIPL